MPYLLGWDASGLTFDAAVHLGTLAAVLLYFWRDWLLLFRSFLRGLTAHGAAVGRYDPAGRLFVWLALATLPAVAAGLALEETVEENVRRPEVVAATLAAFGLVLLWIDRRVVGTLRDVRRVGLGPSLAVGVAQALALVPGVSRSGVTIAAGIGARMDRATAARFSFLLATPIVTGAGLLKLAEVLSGAPDVDPVPLLAGIVAAAVFGLLAIRYLLRYLQTRSLAVFVWYRLALAAAVVIVWAVRQG